MKKLFAFLLVLPTLSAYGAGIPYPCQSKEYSHVCKVERLKITEKRMSVKCALDKVDFSGSMPRFPYYSALLSQANAAYMIDLIKTAKMNNRKIRMYYSCPPANNPRGCKDENCRKLKGVGF
ncbi:MAG: hypothetical protein KJO33_11535 [Gammaproteobacteria bacterium]|nr:hypothetical protein [Gammaproteobacteria bacterium]